jgi:hypothetical protein
VYVEHQNTFGMLAEAGQLAPAIRIRISQSLTSAKEPTEESLCRRIGIGSPRCIRLNERILRSLHHLWDARYAHRSISASPRSSGGRSGMAIVTRGKVFKALSWRFSIHGQAGPLSKMAANSAVPVNVTSGLSPNITLDGRCLPTFPRIISLSAGQSRNLRPVVCIQQGGCWPYLRGERRCSCMPPLRPGDHRWSARIRVPGMGGGATNPQICQSRASTF